MEVATVISEGFQVGVVARYSHVHCYEGFPIVKVLDIKVRGKDSIDRASHSSPSLHQEEGKVDSPLISAPLP